MVPSVSPSLPPPLFPRLFHSSALSSPFHRHYKLLQVYILTSQGPCISFSRLTFLIPKTLFSVASSIILKWTVDWFCLEHLFFFANCPELGTLIVQPRLGAHSRSCAPGPWIGILINSTWNGGEVVLKRKGYKIITNKNIRALNSHYIFIGMDVEREKKTSLY